MIRGRIIMIATALSPVHHGGGTEGNVNMIRRHQVWSDGDKWPVPYISGNSLKGASRRASAWFALSALGLDEEGAGIGKNEIQLVMSGGALTKSGGSVRLDKARAAEALFPTLGLHGYSAGNAMQESQVRVDFLELLCKETADKYAAELEAYGTEDHAAAAERYASEFVEVYWGTRHEPTRRRRVRELMLADERGELELEVSDKKDKKNTEKGDSLQMIYEFEALTPGSVLIGGYTFSHGISEMELQAFRAGLMYASEGRGPNGGLIMRLGGKGSVGFGKVEVQLFGLLSEGVKPPRLYKTEDLCAPLGADEEYDEGIQAYIDKLEESADEAKKALKELA